MIYYNKKKTSDVISFLSLAPIIFENITASYKRTLTSRLIDSI